MNIPLQPLPLKYINGQPYFVHQKKQGILYYEANENALPKTTNNGINLDRFAFINQFIRPWLYQNLMANCTILQPTYPFIYQQK